MEHEDTDNGHVCNKGCGAPKERMLNDPDDPNDRDERFMVILLSMSRRSESL